MCESDRLGESSIYHDFSSAQTAKDEKDNQMIKDKHKIYPGEVLFNEESAYLLDYISRWDKYYNKYHQWKLIDISKQFFGKTFLQGK